MPAAQPIQAARIARPVTDLAQEAVKFCDSVAEGAELELDLELALDLDLGHFLGGFVLPGCAVGIGSGFEVEVDVGADVSGWEF